MILALERSSSPPTNLASLLHPFFPPPRSQGAQESVIRNVDKRTARREHRDDFRAAIRRWRSRPPASSFVDDFDDKREGRPIRVFVRKRPIFPHELRQSEFDVITAPRNGRSIVVHDARMAMDMRHMRMSHNTFDFDAVFGEKVDSAAVYDGAVAPLVASALHGGYTTAMMYGQTGSGKTYTMSSIYRLSSQAVFASLPAGAKVYVSFVEVIGEKCNDMLSFGGQVRLMTGRDGSVRPTPLVDVRAEDADALSAYIDYACALRATAATGVHDASSRSHAVCSIRIESGRGEAQRTGVLNLVDLAGSEHNIDSKDHDARRRKEGAKINASLMALKECVHAVASSHQSGRAHAHMAYRKSKLTYLLKNCFTAADALSVIIATVSPSSKDTEHSLNTLRHACVMDGKRNESGETRFITGGRVETEDVGEVDITAIARARRKTEREGGTVRDFKGKPTRTKLPTQGNIGASRPLTPRKEAKMRARELRRAERMASHNLTPSQAAALATARANPVIGGGNARARRQRGDDASSGGGGAAGRGGAASSKPKVRRKANRASRAQAREIEAKAARLVRTAMGDSSVPYNIRRRQVAQLLRLKGIDQHVDDLDALLRRNGFAAPPLEVEGGGEAETSSPPPSPPPSPSPMVPYAAQRFETQMAQQQQQQTHALRTSTSDGAQHNSRLTRGSGAGSQSSDVVMSRLAEAKRLLACGLIDDDEFAHVKRTLLEQLMTLPPKQQGGGVASDDDDQQATFSMDSTSTSVASASASLSSSPPRNNPRRRDRNAGGDGGRYHFAEEEEDVGRDPSDDPLDDTIVLSASRQRKTRSPVRSKGKRTPPKKQRSPLKPKIHAARASVDDSTRGMSEMERLEHQLAAPELSAAAQHGLMRRLRTLRAEVKRKERQEVQARAQAAARAEMEQRALAAMRAQERQNEQAARELAHQQLLEERERERGSFGGFGGGQGQGQGQQGRKKQSTPERRRIARSQNRRPRASPIASPSAAQAALDALQQQSDAAADWSQQLRSDEYDPPPPRQQQQQQRQPQRQRQRAKRRERQSRKPEWVDIAPPIEPEPSAPAQWAERSPPKPRSRGGRRMRNSAERPPWQDIAEVAPAPVEQQQHFAQVGHSQPWQGVGLDTARSQQLQQQQQQQQLMMGSAQHHQMQWQQAPPQQQVGWNASGGGGGGASSVGSGGGGGGGGLQHFETMVQQASRTLLHPNSHYGR